jgi:hypothetical protein
MIKLILASAAILTGSMANASWARQATAAPVQSAAGDQDMVCKYVVAAGPARDNKPYQLCQSKEKWAAMEAADNKDANRIECHYQDITGSRVKNGKRCMSADMWVQERQMTADYIQKIQAATAGPH